MIWPDGAYSTRFTQPGRMAGTEEGRCPVRTCTYAFPPDLADVARARHASEHDDDDEWRKVVGEMRGARDGETARHRAWIAGWDADMAELRFWLPPTVAEWAADTERTGETT